MKLKSKCPSYDEGQDDYDKEDNDVDEKDNDVDEEADVMMLQTCPP